MHWKQVSKGFLAYPSCDHERTKPKKQKEDIHIRAMDGQTSERMRRSEYKNEAEPDDNERKERKTKKGTNESNDWLKETGSAGLKLD